MVLDKDLCAVQVGHLLERYLPENWYGLPVSELLKVKRPLSAKLDLESFSVSQRRLWICQTDKGLLLRGDWEIFGDDIFFLCTAWVPRLDDLHSLKLKIDDFPLYESSADHLFIIQQHELGLKELEQLGEQLRAQKDMAEMASRAKTSFLATMSHEIRTPMNGILGMTQVLLDSELDSDQREVSETIQFSGNHLLQIINDILDFARLEAGRMEINLQPVGIAELLDESIAICQMQAQEKGVLVTKEVASELSDCYEIDPVRLRQMLVNLIGNAIKFTDAKGSVTVSVSRQAEVLRFEVEDTGCGMSASDAERMFEPFKQADTGSSRRGEGTGLGLAICAKLAAAAGGEIGVTSKPGVGSIFWFSLPLKVATRSTTFSKANTPEVRLDGNVLLVEDNLVNQKVAQAHLDKVGLNVVTVNNGQEAIEILRECEFDIVLMDCHMPVLDGIEATKRLRKAGLQTPIIALTADVLDEARDACSAAGMNDVITKPIQRGELIERIGHYFSL